MIRMNKMIKKEENKQHMVMEMVKKAINKEIDRIQCQQYYLRENK